MRGVAAALLLLAALTGPAAANSGAVGMPAPDLTVQVEPTTLSIGDRLDARLTLRVASVLSGPPRFPVWEEHWGDAEILAVDPPVERGDGVWSQRLVLTVFDTGPATLTSVEVEVPTATETTTVASGQTVIQVDSVLPATDEEIAPQPPEPIHTLPAGDRFWITAALLGLAFLTLAFFVLRSARRVHAALAAMGLSPIEAFQSALVRLRSEAGAERVYIGLSLELRRYLGRSLGFPAAEGTTTQIQRSLRERQLPTELVRDTLGLLREADQVKFAAASADPRRVGERLDDAQRLAAGVEQWLRPEPEAVERVA